MDFSYFYLLLMSSFSVPAMKWPHVPIDEYFLEHFVVRMDYDIILCESLCTDDLQINLHVDSPIFTKAIALRLGKFLFIDDYLELFLMFLDDKHILVYVPLVCIFMTFFNDLLNVMKK